MIGIHVTTLGRMEIGSDVLGGVQFWSSVLEFWSGLCALLEQS